MSEHGLIFTGDSVHAILRGDKTQTRRVIKQWKEQPYLEGQYPMKPMLLADGSWGWGLDGEIQGPFIRCPYGTPGDLIYVKETWWQEYQIGFDEATNECGKPLRIAHYEPPQALDYGRTVVKRSPLYMPRWAARITLRLTDVRIQRLQNITEEDAIAEGVRCGIDCPDHRIAFGRLWNLINARRGHPWERNDHVWALTFERTET
jgi:hypothetical protein